MTLTSIFTKIWSRGTSVSNSRSEVISFESYCPVTYRHTNTKPTAVARPLKRSVIRLVKQMPAQCSNCMWFVDVDWFDVSVGRTHDSSRTADIHSSRESGCSHTGNSGNFFRQLDVHLSWHRNIIAAVISVSNNWLICILRTKISGLESDLVHFWTILLQVLSWARVLYFCTPSIGFESEIWGFECEKRIRNDQNGNNTIG